MGRATLTIAASADTKPPTLERAEVPRTGRTLRLTFSEPLDEAAPHRPAATVFAVTVAGEPRAVTTVTITGETVVLGLASPVGPGQEVTVSYTAPESGSGQAALQDPADHVVASFVDAAVDNQAQAGRGTGGGGAGRRGRWREPGRSWQHGRPSHPGPSECHRALEFGTAGQLNTADDVDYFTLSLPQAGVLVVETTGRTDTACTVWQAGEELATADRGGGRRNCGLSVPVEAGPVVIAVRGSPDRELYAGDALGGGLPGESRPELLPEWHWGDLGLGVCGRGGGAGD